MEIENSKRGYEGGAGGRPKISRRDMVVGQPEDRARSSSPKIIVEFLGVFAPKKNVKGSATLSVRILSCLDNAGRNFYDADPNVCRVVKDPFGKEWLMMKPYYHKSKCPIGVPQGGDPGDFLPYFVTDGQEIYLAGPYRADNTATPCARSEENGNMLELHGLQCVVNPYQYALDGKDEEKRGKMQYTPKHQVSKIGRPVFTNLATMQKVPISPQNISFVEALYANFTKEGDGLGPGIFAGRQSVVEPKFNPAAVDKEWLDKNIVLTKKISASFIVLPKYAPPATHELLRGFAPSVFADLIWDPSERHPKDFEADFSGKDKSGKDVTWLGLHNVLSYTDAQGNSVFLAANLNRHTFFDKPMRVLGVTNNTDIFRNIWVNTLSYYVSFFAPAIYNLELDLERTGGLTENADAFTTWATDPCSVVFDVRAMLATVGLPITKKYAKEVYNRIMAGAKRPDPDLGDILELTQGVVPLHAGTSRANTLLDDDNADDVEFYMLHPLKSLEAVTKSVDDPKPGIYEYVSAIRAKAENDPARVTEILKYENSAKLAEAIGALSNFAEYSLPKLKDSLASVALFAVFKQKPEFSHDRVAMASKFNVTAPQPDLLRVQRVVDHIDADGMLFASISLAACVNPEDCHKILNGMVNDGLIYFKEENPDKKKQSDEERYRDKRYFKL